MPAQDLPGDETTEQPPESAETEKSPPTLRQRGALLRLQSSPDWIDRVHALADLLVDEPRFASAAFAPPLSDMAEIDDPDLRCFQLAKELYRHLGPRLPKTLAPFLNRTDIEQRDESRHQTTLADQISAWVGTRRPRSVRSLRLVLQLLQHPGAGATVVVSAHLTSQRIDDAPRTGMQLRQLLADANRDPDVLPVEQKELLGVLLEPLLSSSILDFEHTFEFSGSALLRLILAVADSPMVTWADVLPEQLALAAGLTARQRPQLATGTLSIVPVLSHATGSPLVVLEHKLPDGHVLEPGEYVVLRSSATSRREPTLVLSQGAFWMTRGDPPPILSQLFESTGGFDPTPGPMRALVEPLARAFPAFRASLAGHTRVHAVHPAVSLELADDDWLQCRAFACTHAEWRPGEPVPDGATLFEWLPDGRWVDSASQPEAIETGEATTDESSADGDGDPTESVELQRVTEADGQDDDASQTDAAVLDAPPPPLSGPLFFEEPDSRAVAPLNDWLETFRDAADKQRSSRSVAASSAGAGFAIRLTARSVENFSDAWETRPEGVAWYGNNTVLRLLETPTAPKPKLRVVSSGVDWFTVSSEWAAEGSALTEADLGRLREANAPFVRLPSGWVRKDEAQVHDDVAGTLADLGIEPGLDDQRISLLQLAQASPDALTILQGPEGNPEAVQRVSELREKVAAFDGLPRIPVPDAVQATLRPYQRDGLDFLSYTTGLGLGAILADDMGLGKTIQALVWLVREIKRDPDGGPTLVVCPASVLHNWEREAAGFAPELKVLSLTAGAERHQLREQIPHHDLVLTNYALLRRDSEELARISWRAVILDEAQNIKNPDAAVSRAARGLQAQHRLALTGTPLENRALDLWSIQAFLNPGYLGTRASFARHYDHPDAPPHARTLLAAKLRPVMVRRLKGEVAPELPPRIEEQLDCELTPGQRQLYLAELAKGRTLLDELSASGGVRRNKISILAVLTRLRQICCHPGLVGGKDDLGSGKFKAFFELVEPILGEGHKVLVFSQFVQCLKRVASDMEARGIPYHMLTGSSRNRGEIVAAFEADPNPSVFLVSLKAGGTGLNLTAASYVVLFDPWWNPAVEAQAIDRTHRIGQDRTVIAYRLVSQGTIEERIRELQESKASLARGVLGEDGFAKALTRDDLDYLLADL